MSKQHPLALAPLPSSQTRGDQGGALSPGSPCSEDLKEIRPQSRTRKGPKKNLSPRVGPKVGGVPLPPTTALGVCPGFHSDGSQSPASPLLEKEEGAAPKAHSPSNLIPRLASPQFPSRWGPHSEGKMPVTPLLGQPQCPLSPPSPIPQPAASSGRQLCSLFLGWVKGGG